MIILVSIATFLMLHFMVGDPLNVYIHNKQLEGMTEADRQMLRVEFGLNKPLVIQYLNWANGVLHGDLGTSWSFNMSVSTLVKQSLPITLYLSVLSLLLCVILGPVIGTICALKRGTWIDFILTIAANLGITIPSFWLGIVLIYILALKLGWLPTNGYTSPFNDFWLSTRQVIMPVICLALPPIAGLARQTRSAVLEVVHKDYVRTAWSKGMSERTIVIRHVIKNAFLPIITMIGMQVAMIFGGAVLIETVFNIPGMGRLLVNAVFSQDYQIVQGGTLIMATLVMITNIIVDISYGWIDPRIRYN